MKTRTTGATLSYEAPKLQVVGSVASVAERLTDAVTAVETACAPVQATTAYGYGSGPRRLH